MNRGWMQGYARLPPSPTHHFQELARLDYTPLHPTLSSSSSKQSSPKPIPFFFQPPKSPRSCTQANTQVSRTLQELHENTKTTKVYMKTNKTYHSPTPLRFKNGPCNIIKCFDNVICGGEVVFILVFFVFVSIAVVVVLLLLLVVLEATCYN